ncbi:MAG: hypothetical protein AABN34_12710 [Acidobacteriota bacterium]
MRVEGRWHLFDDGILRPVVDTFVQTPEGTWQAAMLLLDAGADRTVFEARLLTVLQKLAVPADEAPELGGVGGKAACIFARTRLGFVRDDGQLVNVQGLFGVFTNLTSSDVSILGRDVTNNFDVVYSFPRREVMLLAPPHSYQIHLPS